MRISTTGLNGARKALLEEPVQSHRTIIEDQIQPVVTENAQMNGSRPQIAWIEAAAPGEIEVLDFLFSLIRMLKPAEAVVAGIGLGTASVAIGSALRNNGFGRLTSRIADPAAARFGMARVAAADLADWVNVVTDEGLDESTGFQFALFDPDIHPRSLEFNRIYQRLALGATVVFRAKSGQEPDAADAIGELIAEGRLTGSFIQRCGLVFVGSVQHCPASQTPRLAIAPAPKRKAILVLGVHRSGTSSLAHLLNVLGAKLPEELLGPGHGNPLGHWEPKRLIQINKAILAAIGRNWKDPGPIPRNWFRSKEAYTFHESIAAEITSAYGDAPLILIKEPRICRIAPLYLDVLDGLGIEPLVILLVRDPGEVIESLKERDQLDSNTIELLWLRSLLEAEEATRGCKRVWTSFDQLLGDWRASLQSITAGLDVTWPNDVATVACEAAEIVRPRHRHHRSRDNAALCPLTGLTVQAWGAAQNGLNGNEAAARALFDAIRTPIWEMDRLSSVHADGVKRCSDKADKMADRPPSLRAHFPRGIRNLLERFGRAIYEPFGRLERRKIMPNRRSLACIAHKFSKNL